MKLKIQPTKRIGYGTTNLRDPEQVAIHIREAIRAGYDYLDCAWIYGNEANIGMKIKEIANKEKDFNYKIAIQSKVWPSQYKGGINKALKLAINKISDGNEITSYMLHRPANSIESTLTSWKQLVDCKKSRDVQVVGVGNFDKDIIEKLEEATNYLPEFNQIELSVNNMRYDRIEYCQRKGIKIQAYSVMGDLENNLKNSVLIKIAEKHKVKVPQILIAFLMNLGIEPIVCSLNVDHIRENIKARDVVLDKEDMKLLSKLNTYKNNYPETHDIDLDKIQRES